MRVFMPICQHLHGRQPDRMCCEYGYETIVSQVGLKFIVLKLCEYAKITHENPQTFSSTYYNLIVLFTIFDFFFWGDLIFLYFLKAYIFWKIMFSSKNIKTTLGVDKVKTKVCFNYSLQIDYCQALSPNPQSKNPLGPTPIKTK